MKKTVEYIIYIFVICIFGILLLDRKKCAEDTDYKTDTVYLTKHDTIRDTVLRYKDKRTIDTIYLEVPKEDHILRLPLEQKMYESCNYKLWVSGYRPALDSIYVFKNTEYKLITNTITNTEVDNRWGIYVFGGLNSITDTFVPSVGISIASPKRWLISAEYGIRGGSSSYGIKIGYKLNK